MLIGYGPSGVTCDFFAFNAANEVWDGVGFVAWVDADYQDYRITATETGTSGRFAGTAPTGTFYYELRIRAATLADSIAVYSDQYMVLNVSDGTQTMLGRGPTATIHDFFAYNPANEVWNGSAFVTWVDANYASYRIAATQVGSSGLFTATAPTGAETYELRTRAATLLDSAVVDNGYVELATSGVTLPPDPSQTTGFIKVFDNAGTPEADVTITSTVADVVTQVELGGLTLVSGIALDNTPRDVQSDGSGVATFTGLFKGVTYTFKRGSHRPQTVTIPLSAGSTYQIPVLIGNP